MSGPYIHHHYLPNECAAWPTPPPPSRADENFNAALLAIIPGVFRAHGQHGRKHALGVAVEFAKEIVKEMK